MRTPNRLRRRPLSLPTAFLSAALASSAVQAQEPWSVESPTGPARELRFDATQGTWMSVSVTPDGRSIVFDLLGHIYEMPVEGGTARRLTEGRSWNLFPRVSPDGRSIAFSSDRTGHFEVWTMDRQGGSLRNVSEARNRSWDNLYRPSWSADGQRIYAAGQGDGFPGQLIAFDVRGGRQVLVRGGGMSSPEPDVQGTRVFFERAAGMVHGFAFNPYVIPPGGTRIERYDLATGETGVHIERPGGAFAPALSPNGRELAYAHRAIDSTVLIVQDLATARERTVLRGLDRDRQQGSGYGPYPTFAWHPDGKRIFIGVGGQLVSVDVATGKTTRIPFSAPVQRQMSETIRFQHHVPVDKARTRQARWGTRTSQGVLFEALGDIWLAAADGSKRNVTRSDDHETSPVMDAKTGTIYFASWTDDSLGGVYRTRAGGSREALTRVPSQYGSLALSRDGTSLAYVRGTGGLARGLWLSNETTFELIVRPGSGVERRITEITGQPLEYANIAGKIPPSVMFGPSAETLYFTEFERDTLVLKRIGLDGRGEVVLVKFPNAVEAVPSPDLQWIALREYQRSFVTPFTDAGSTTIVSPFEGQGYAVRVDREDGGYLAWSADGRTLSWTRASGFYEKDLAKILAEGGARPAGGSSDWTGPRVPGSTAQRTDLAMEIELDRPKGVVALTGVRIATMNAGRDVLENATIVVEGNRIAAIGASVTVPAGAKVFDLRGQTVIPGLIDAHAHPHIEHSPLHVIEQRPTYLSAPLAYGVTTVVEVYGNEYRDGWLSDMTRAGKITGPRFFTTGSVIYGSRRGGRLRMYRPIETLDDALEQLRWNKDHGAIAVKDYLQFTRKRRHLTATAARQLGLNVLSETAGDPQMNLTQLLDGVTGLEHSMGLAPFYDDIVKYWGGTTAGMTPTLLVVYNGAMGEGWYHGASKLWQDEKLTRFITPEHLMRVRSPIRLWPEDMYAWTMAKEIKKLWANGTSLQLGAHGQMFGLDAHWELDLFVKGGFTPAEALEIGTIRGAAQHGLAGEIGSLEVGKLADLVVLEANPLEDIANAGRIRYVMKDGVLFAGADAARVWPDPKPAGKPYFVRETAR
jgi:WD40 repeat protein